MQQVRIHRSIEEIIIFSISILATLAVTPFALYRLLQQQYLIASIQIVCVIGVSIIGAYVWRTRNTKIAGIIVSSFLLAISLTIIYMLGPTRIFWLFPVIMAVSFLCTSRTAALLITPSFFVLQTMLLNVSNLLETIIISVTLLITYAFSFVVSSRIKQQQVRLQTQINRDALTGALNRRSLNHRLELLQSLYFRHKEQGASASSLILFDIDNFKKINDTYSHLEGDEILVRITNTITDYIRRTDELYRYGGEKFVLVANGVGLIKAGELAEKIRVLIEESELSTKTKVTASFGVAQVQKHESSKKWLIRADEALYRSKRAGKNRVCLANYDKPETQAIISESTVGM